MPARDCDGDCSSHDSQDTPPFVVDELYAYITRNASVGVTEPELLRQFGEGYAKPLAALQEEGEVFYKTSGGQQVFVPL